MKTGERVVTPYGTGTFVKYEGNEGVLVNRCLVRVDVLPPSLKKMQDKFGGLYFFKEELA